VDSVLHPVRNHSRKRRVVVSSWFEIYHDGTTVTTEHFATEAAEDTETIS
jgi:hypothetical protein